MLELYQAYSDYRGMMELIQNLIRYLVRDVLKKDEIKMPDGEVIDFMGEWKEVRYKDLVCEKVNDSGWFELSKSEKIQRARALGLEVDEGFEDYEVSDEVFGKLIEPNLIQPTFVTHLPKEFPHKITLEIHYYRCLRALYCGMEIAPAYSEQNDPDMRRKCSRSRRARKLRISTTTFWKPSKPDAFRWGDGESIGSQPIDGSGKYSDEFLSNYVLKAA